MVWPRASGRAIRASKALKVGTVWCNTYRTYSVTLPFGGMKRSGVGREWGLEGIEEFLETKSIMISTAERAPIATFVPR
jgi:aldehyde dehydrogenase (NAD+)